jgi:hypothetical protein
MPLKGYRQTEEHKQKTSKALKGNKNTLGHQLSFEHRQKIGNANKNKHKLSLEHKQKLIKARKGIKPYKMTNEIRQKISKTLKGIKRLPFSKEHREKISKARKGKYMGNKCPSWKGGITPIVKLIRQSNKYKNWRQQIFIRDNFICQKCKKEGGKLEVHHINSFNKLLREAWNYMPLFGLYEGAMLYTPLWNINNGITLCKKCHLTRR